MYPSSEWIPAAAACCRMVEERREYRPFCSQIDEDGSHPLHFTALNKSEIYIGSSQVVAWPSGLRRWFKAPVISMAWVRIPPLPTFSLFTILTIPDSFLELIFSS